MKNFVDVLDELKTARQKEVNRTSELEHAWKVFRESPGHTTRTLKADIQHAVHQASHELYTILENAVFTVDAYRDADDTEKVSVKIAFIPYATHDAHAAQESMMLDIIVDHITSLGLTSLVNDICVNDLQQRF